MEAGQHRIALPLLREIDQIVESRHLEGWEDAEILSSHLRTLHRCLGAFEGNADYQKRVYDRLCALDPLQALELTNQS
jgi:hypothetical protein